MDLRLADKTCLVTGASAGIGRATALALAAEGARVVIAARSVERLRPLVEEIEAMSGRARLLASADLATPDGPNRLADATLAQVGRIDVLVNTHDALEHGRVLGKVLIHIV